MFNAKIKSDSTVVYTLCFELQFNNILYDFLSIQFYKKNFKLIKNEKVILKI